MAPTLDTLPSSPTETIEILKTEMDTPFWEKRLIQLMKSAAEGDKNVWALIYQLVREADSGRLSWGYHKSILSGMVYILSYVGDSKSYRILMNYVKSLDRTVPIGAIELIADMIATFKELDVEEVFQIANHIDELKSAFGVMALTKLALENRLAEEQKVRTREFLSTYKNRKYYLDGIIETTLEYLEEPKEESSDLLSQLDGMF
ncbi:hypothetical protein [Leptospira ilyithenensis]|uniref:HEAT repeat domain-containing protein n=1 Tax=Leptospira ilyithenensis TaxID=2484901 RepID=A0A4R9LRI3_9LEPT|nr:hypothetical protein [Leptospira ilyithenensis]TGN11133.1 hypothetical protein EHS11_08230 [Leptospira ilyithenensis]